MVKFAKQIVIISGATCTGKSKFALEFASKNNGAIVNSDALQVYSDLKILSAQPSIKDQKLVDHHLYSFLDCKQKYSVGLWLEMVKNIIEKIWQDNKLPIVVGGTGFYISKLIDGISIIPEISLQAKYQAEQFFLDLGIVEFQKKYGEGKITDPQRLIRACEILLSTQKPITYWQSLPPQKIFPDAKFFHVNLNLERNIIYQNCDQRFLKMLKNGAIEEVENFLKKNHDENLSITKTLGYVEIKDYLLEKISYQEMQKIIQQKTRNYAKRQLTWFRHQFDDINFFENTLLAENFLKKNFS